VRIHDKTKKNPLTNKAMMNKVNPFAGQQRKLMQAQEEKRKVARKAAIKAKQSKAERHKKAKRTKLDQERHAGLVKSFKDAEDFIAEEERQGNYMPGDTEEEDDE